MKKMLLAAITISGLVLATSCSKNYTCTCTSVEPNGTVNDTKRTTISGTKGGAEEKCKQFDNVNGNVTTTCLLD